MVPTPEQCMLPLLQLAADGQIHRFTDASEQIADVFNLTENERKQTFANGRGRILLNRIYWAFVYLSQAQLMGHPNRGCFEITNRGREVLAENHETVSCQLLMRYEEFRGFRKRRRTKRDEQSNHESIDNPEEILERSYQQLREDVAATLLATIKDCSPAFFENLVVDLLLAMGYGGSRLDAGQALGRSGDGGVDGIIKEDKLGLDVVFVQAKRWESTVGRPVVQAFAGALEGQRARKGVLITTSDFSAEAREYVERIDKKIVLIDGDRLADLMMDHGVGITRVTAYPVFRIDSDYFEQE